jgi:hypothetical protein
MTEWLGTTKGEPFNYEKNDGRIHPSCIICKGVKSTAEARLDFIPDAIGHKVDCKHYEGPVVETRRLRWA